MPKVVTRAADLDAGDSIDFAGVEFILVETSGHSGKFIELNFNTTEVKDRINTDMFIDCRPSTPFTVITK